jgi:hypothetical protein
MIFGIVHLVCKVVHGHDVALFNAVPQQHTTLEHFDQTGAAVHLALCKRSMALCKSLMPLRAGPTRGSCSEWLKR